MENECVGCFHKYEPAVKDRKDEVENVRTDTFSNIYIGQERFNAQGRAYLLLPDNTAVDVTPGLNPRPQFCSVDMRAIKHRFKLQSVEWTNGVEILQDTGAQAAYGPPHWAAGQTNQSPVLYGAGNRMAGQVKIKDVNLTGQESDVSDEVGLFGAASFGSFVGTNSTSSSVDEFFVSVTNEAALTADKVRHFPAFNTTWTITRVGTKAMNLGLGNSASPVYVARVANPSST